MGIANAVQTLTTALQQQQRFIFTAWQSQTAAHLKAMPHFLSEGRLDVWERAVQDSFPEQDEDTTVATLLFLIFELGRSNLYTRFDQAHSETALAEVVQGFMRAGLTVPAGLDVSTW